MPHTGAPWIRPGPRTRASGSMVAGNRAGPRVNPAHRNRNAALLRAGYEDGPALTVDSTDGEIPQGRELSFAWLTGTVMTGLTSVMLMGAALYVSFQGQDTFSTAYEALQIVTNQADDRHRFGGKRPPASAPWRRPGPNSRSSRPRSRKPSTAATSSASSRSCASVRRWPRRRPRSRTTSRCTIRSPCSNRQPAGGLAEGHSGQHRYLRRRGRRRGVDQAPLPCRPRCRRRAPFPTRPPPISCA